VEERARVMELVEGAELHVPITEEETLAVVQQLIDALELWRCRRGRHGRGVLDPSALAGRRTWFFGEVKLKLP
jgi:hypothetical protein